MATLAQQLASSLIARQKASNAGYRLRAAELRVQVKDVLRARLIRDEIKRAWLIGSLTGEHFGARSDVDVVVEGLPPQAAAAFAFELSRTLDHGVDLLRLEDLTDGFQRRVVDEGMRIDVT